MPSDADAFFADQDRPFAEDIIRLVQQLGRIILNAGIYGTGHRMTIDAVREAFPLVRSLSAQEHPVSVDILDGALYIDARRCSMGNRLVLAFVQRLEELGVSGFTIAPGMDDDEFLNLLDLLLAPPPDKGGPDFHEELARRGLEHVQAATRELRVVGDEEVVLNREDFERIAAGESVSGASDSSESNAQPETPAPEPAPPILVEQVIAFLKGEIGAEDEVNEELRELIKTPERLAQLIIEATAVRRSNGELPRGESLADFVIGCLRRTFEELRTDPKSRTAKGVRSLKKALLMLEKEVVEKLRTLLPDEENEWRQWIDEACSEMTDELEVESLATEYARRMHALEKTEKRLLRFLKKNPQLTKSQDMEDGDTETGARESPLPEWKRMTWQLGGEKGAGDTAPTNAGQGSNMPLPEDLGVLAVLLTELDRLMRAGKLDPETSGAIRARAEKEVKDLAAKTCQRIQDLDQLQPLSSEETPAASPEDEEAKRRAAKEKELLAEIVQQLCQLAVSLNGSLAMITYGLNNSIPPEHWDILTIAVRSGRELNDMLQFLRSKVGLPHTLAPVNPKNLIVP